MAQQHLTPEPASLEDALTALFCVVDDAYRHLNPTAASRYASLKRLSDSKVLTLAFSATARGRVLPLVSARGYSLFRPFFPGAVELNPSSFHRRVRKLGRFLEPLKRVILPELVGEPETLLVDSTLVEISHPRQVSQSAGMDGAAWVRWGSFSVYGLKVHLICATNRVPISYEIIPANIAEVSLTEELVAEADLSGEVARRLFGDLPTTAGR